MPSLQGKGKVWRTCVVMDVSTLNLYFLPSRVNYLFLSRMGGDLLCNYLLRRFKMYANLHVPIHTYPHKPLQGRSKWPDWLSNLLVTSCLIGNMQAQQSMVIHDTECPYWDQVSLNNTELKKFKLRGNDALVKKNVKSSGLSCHACVSMIWV